MFVYQKVNQFGGVSLPSTVLSMARPESVSWFSGLVEDCRDHRGSAGTHSHLIDGGFRQWYHNSWLVYN